MLGGFAFRSKGACHRLHLPAGGKLAPGGLVGWAGWGFWRDAVLCAGTIGPQGVVESLLRRLVLILEWRDGAVLSDPLPGMLCQILLRVGDGLRHFLLHEILVDQVLEPAALSLYGTDAHHAIAVVQQIGIELVVEEQCRCTVGRACGVGVGVEPYHHFLGGIVHGFHHIGVGIGVGIHVVKQRPGRGVYQLSVFGRICNLVGAIFIYDIFLFYIFIFIIYIIIIIAPTGLHIFLRILHVFHISFRWLMPDGSVESH